MILTPAGEDFIANQIPIIITVDLVLVWSTELYGDECEELKLSKFILAY